MQVALLLKDPKHTREQLRKVARGPARAETPFAPRRWWSRPKQKFQTVDKEYASNMWTADAVKMLNAYVRRSISTLQAQVAVTNYSSEQH